MATPEPENVPVEDEDDAFEAWERERYGPTDPYQNAPLGSPYSDD